MLVVRDSMAQLALYKFTMLMHHAISVESGRYLLKQRSRKSRHSGEMFSGMGGGPLLLAMWNRADTCMCNKS